MTDEVCYVSTSASLSALDSNLSGVVLRHDLRPKSPRIAAVCAAEIKDAGREVHYCGALPTPALALYAASFGLQVLVFIGATFRLIAMASSFTVPMERLPRWTKMQF